MSLFKAVTTIGGYTMLSRIFGFLRELLVASCLGAGAASDAFFVAFKLPNFLRRLFAEGAFNAAFVPLFAGTLEQEGKEAAKHFAEEIFSVLTVILLLIILLAELFMPWVVLAFAPGFDAEPDKFALAVLLSRICFPYILFISLLTLYSGILNSLHYFAAASAAPIMLNICMITALLLSRSYLTNPAITLSWAVSLAGVLQFLWMALACHRIGILPGWRRPRFSPKVITLLKLSLPAAFGASVAQVNLLIDMVLASSIPNAVSWLYYGDRLNELVIGVIGVAIGTALLPMLSRAIKSNDTERGLHYLNQGSFFCLVFALPSAVALASIARPIIATLFEHGAFTAEDTAAVFPALIAYALGLPAFVMIKVLSPGFYARQDTATPVKIGIACVILNLAGNLILMRYFQHVGLALSTTISGWVNMFAMAYILYQRGHFRPDVWLLRQLGRIGFAVALMALSLCGGMDLLSWTTKQERILSLMILIAGGGGIYLLAIAGLGVVTQDDLRKLRPTRSA